MKDDPKTPKFHRLNFTTDSKGRLRGEMASPDLEETPYGALYRDRQGRIFRKGLGDLLRGETTAVALYRDVLDLTTVEMGKLTGLGRRRVKRHETVKGFGAATVADLEAYARIFGLAPRDLLLFLDRPDVEADVETQDQGLFTVLHLRKAKHG